MEQPVLKNQKNYQNYLKKNNLKHNVLNAKQHEKEASIIAQAGRLEAITIATNMAGRGTDIQLGGNLELRKLEASDKDQEEINLKKKNKKSWMLVVYSL